MEIGNAARRKILVVDDEPMVLSVLNRLLKQEYEVVTANSGKEAMQILEDEPSFDLVLCDLMMADASGIDLYEWVEKQCPKLASKIAFITGGSFTSRTVEFLKRVNNRLIEKPFEPSELKDLVGNLIVEAEL